MHIHHCANNQVCASHIWTLKLQKVPVYKPDGRDFKETRNLLLVQQVHREPLLTIKVEVLVLSITEFNFLYMTST